MAHLGKYVRERRAKLGMTQADVTAAGGPSDTTLTGIENGTAASVSPATLRKLDRGLNWPPSSAKQLYAGETPLPVGPFAEDESTDGSSGNFTNLLEQREAEFRKLLLQHGSRDEAALLAARVHKGVMDSWTAAADALALGMPATLIKNWVDAGFQMLAGSGSLMVISQLPELFDDLLQRYRQVSILVDKAMDESSPPSANSLWPYSRHTIWRPKGRSPGGDGDETESE